MKKYVFLLVCLIGITSCTDHKDLYNPDNESEQKKEEYDKNFPVTDVDPNQDWNSFRSIKVQVAVNEIAGETYTVKIYTDNPLNVKSGAMLLAKGDVRNGETYTSNVEVGKGLSGIYAARVDSKGACLVKYASVKDGIASVTFGTTARSTSSARSVQAGSVNLDGVIESSPYSKAEIEGFLAKATELKDDNSPWNLQKKYYKVTGSYTLPDYIAAKEALIIIPEGATLKTNRGQIGTGCTIVVLGSMEIGGCTQFQDSKLIVFPQGEIRGESLNFTNPANRLAFYNAGTVNLAGTLIVNGQRFYNCGKVDVKAYEDTSNKGRFVNNGHFYTSSMSLTKSDLYILCYTHIGTFASEFKDCYVSDGAYFQIDEKLYSGEKSRIYLGKNSKLSTHIYYYNATQIIAPATQNEQAYIKIGVISSGHGDGTWWLGGPSTGYYIVDIDYSSWDWQNDYSKDSFEKEFLGHNTELENNFTPASLEITPPSGNECSGNTTIGGLPTEDKVNCAYYAFEDMGSVGDYDFNDVVLKVSRLSNESQATVELVAAGGTLATAVKYGNEILWDEVHHAFGVDLSTMVNTGRGNALSIPEVKTISVAPNTSFTELRFAITVTYNDGSSTSTVESVPSKGNTPQYLCMSGEWKWPKENISITQAYSMEDHSFEDWAQNSGNATDWYKYPISGKVFE